MEVENCESDVWGATKLFARVSVRRGESEANNHTPVTRERRVRPSPWGRGEWKKRVESDEGLRMSCYPIPSDCSVVIQ